MDDGASEEVGHTVALHEAEIPCEEESSPAEGMVGDIAEPSAVENLTGGTAETFPVMDVAGNTAVIKETDKAGDSDFIYRYIKDDMFTSEIYKVEIQNLPKYVGFNDVKKFLTKYGVNPHKIKLFGKHTFAFVTFKSEEERDKAMKVIHGVMWKNRNLRVRLAKPKADPILKKRKIEEGSTDQMEAKRPAQTKDCEEEESFSKRIADIVTPLWNIPYEEQLKKKEQEVLQVLQKLTKEIGSNNRAILPWIFVQKQKYNNSCCQLEGLTPSPSQTEYRNKCEFLIGMDPKVENKTIGYRLAKYTGGTCAVVEPFDTIHIPAITKVVVQAFQDYIRSTHYSVYSPETYEGHWKQLTVRTTNSNHVMAVVYFNPQKLDKKELDSLKRSLGSCFTEGSGKDSGVTSLYFVEDGQRKSPSLEDLPLEHLAGEKYIYEELLGLKFRISPHAFFQVNTRAAEMLYSTIGDWAHLDQDTTVLDVCCGTGTIGISLAKKVKKVIGVELSQEAVKDARVNAEINGLTNIEFHCGKAEDLFPALIYSQISKKLVAVVDPPRAGLHSKVILAIRRAEHLKRLIYVSCSARAAMNNFVDLCRAPSNRVKGAYFKPVRVMAFDMFPQTVYFELVILFERVEYPDEPPEKATQSAKQNSESSLEAHITDRHTKTENASLEDCDLNDATACSAEGKSMDSTVVE